MTGRVRLGATAVAVAAVLAPALCAGASASPTSRTSPVGARTATGGSSTARFTGGVTGPLPASFSSLVGRYLTRRPALGPVHVVDIGTGDFDTQLLAESLAGIVNRREVQIYTVQGSPSDADRASEQFWLDEYQREGLITVAKTESLDAALTDFASIPSGYIVADDAEPWTIDAATTLASVDNALVVTSETVAEAQAAGLTQVADLRGRWSSAQQCYQDMQQNYAAKTDSRALGMVAPTDSRLRDFLIQQGIFTMYARAQAPDWSAEIPIMRSFGSGIPVFGYIATNGVEEFYGTLELSQEGKYLVPSDTVENLSFHLAVRADQPAAIATLPANRHPCRPGAANVIPVVTDGDNLAVESEVYARADEWRSPSRGQVPLGWSISPLLSFLAPGIWDYYVTTRGPADELVAMMGIGYTFPSQMANGADFYDQSFSLMDYLGLRSYWSLDLGLVAPTAGGGLNPAWSVPDGAGRDGVPSDVLVSYGEVPGAPLQFTTHSGVPAWLPLATTYGDSVQQMASRVEGVAASPPAAPGASFLPAAVWNFSITGLESGLAGAAASGARYLTPSQAAACVAGGLPVTAVAARAGGGYRLVSAAGVDYSYGGAANYGGPVAAQLARPVTSVASTPDGGGYWEAAADGGVFAFGDATYFGSTGQIDPTRPPGGANAVTPAGKVDAMIATPDGRGYWLVSSDGGVFAFGDASYRGSLHQVDPSRPPGPGNGIGDPPFPVVAAAATPDGAGYSLATPDGGLFVFGDAQYPPEFEARILSSPVVGIAATPDGKGLWQVTAEGDVFGLGDARLYGSPAAPSSVGTTQLGAPIVGIASTPDGGGYWLAGSDGGVYAYGDAAFAGSVPGS